MASICRGMGNNGQWGATSRGKMSAFRWDAKWADEDLIQIEVRVD